jgi:hypothetical protein
MSDLLTLCNQIENTSARAGARLHAALPHVLTVSGVGDEVRSMLTAYAAKTDDLNTVSAMLEAHLGDDAYRIQGWIGAVRALAAVDRDYGRDVRTGDVDHPRWAAALGSRMLARLGEIERLADEIVAEA